MLVFIFLLLSQSYPCPVLPDIRTAGFGTLQPSHSAMHLTVRWGPWWPMACFPHVAFLMGVRRFLFQLVLCYNILQHIPSYAIIYYIYSHQNILVLKCLSVFSHVWTKNNKNIKPQSWYIQVTCLLVPETVCTFVDGQWLTTSLTLTFDVRSASEVSIICLDLGTHVQLTYSMMSPMGKIQALHFLSFWKWGQQILARISSESHEIPVFARGPKNSWLCPLLIQRGNGKSPSSFGTF
jgi:hypothetical protein